MKKVCLVWAFLFLVKIVWASCAANTVDYYTLDNTFNSACGGTALVQVGTLPFTASPAPPSPSTQWAGPFGSSNYAKASATLVTALNNATTGTIEFAVQFNSLANNPVCIGTNNGNVWVQASSLGALSFGTTNGNNLSTGNGVVTIGVSYYLAVTWDTTNKKIYLGTYSSGVLGAVAQVATVANAGTPFGSLTNLYFGVYQGNGDPVNGYMGLVRVSSDAKTSFPTTDPPSSSPTFTPTVTQTFTVTLTKTNTPSNTATPSVTSTSTNSPSPSSTPTITPTPCGVNYLDDFHSYTVGALLNATPGYVGITGSTTTWTVQSGLGFQAAGSNAGSGWTSVRYKTSFANYFDWKTTVKDTRASGLFFHTSTYDSTPFPTDGFMLQIPNPGTMSLYRMPGLVVIGYTDVVPASYNNFTVEVVDNAGVIDVYIDRAPTADGGPPAGNGDIHVIDLKYTSGFWGWNELNSDSLFSNVSVNGGSCLATNTPTFTPPPTPTPANVPSSCVTPWPQVFTPVLTPILVAQKTYEHGCVLEPSVLKVNGVPHMVYSANSFSAGGDLTTIGLSTTTDPLGLSGWNHLNSPIIGAGNGGETGYAYEATQLQVGAEYRVYYTDTHRNKKFATSTDGITYSAGNGGQPVIAFNALNQYGAVGINNVGFWLDTSTGYYYATVEATYDTTNFPSERQFQTALFKSTDGALTFQMVVRNMPSLSAGTTIYGGPRTLVKVHGMWHLYYHKGVPTSLYHAFSPDLYNWIQDSTYTLTFTTHMFGLPNCNQAADNSVVDFGSQTNFYYDGTDNSTPAGAIGVAVAKGPLSSVVRCGAETTNLALKLNLKKSFSLNQQH